MKLNGMVSAIALAAALAAGSAQAGTLAFEPGALLAPNDYQANNPVNLGMVFTANSNIEATALGFYDIPDLTGPEVVTLYNSSGVALASVSVSPSDPLVGGYHLDAIAPVALTAGQTYTVSAQVNDNPWQYGTLAPTPPQITFLYDDYLYGSSPAFPTTAGGSGPAYFGPDLAIAVPEPATWAMMLLGVLGLGAVLRNRRRRPSAGAAAA